MKTATESGKSVGGFLFVIADLLEGGFLKSLKLVFVSLLVKLGFRHQQQFFIKWQPMSFTMPVSLCGKYKVMLI